MKYLQDTKKFWKAHKESKNAIDRDIASRPLTEQRLIRAKMRANHAAMRRAKKEVIMTTENEAREDAITRISKVFEDYYIELDSSAQHLLQNQDYFRQLARRVYDAGYRLIPDLKPLTDEEIDKIWEECEKKDPMQTENFSSVISQATVDKINKQLGG